MEKEKKKKLNKPEYYLNREWSWLEFNNRVLYEAINKENPLLERVKFLSIVTSNLEEFFMVRVAGLKKQKELDMPGTSIDMKSPAEQLKGIRKRTKEMLEKQYNVFNEILTELKKSGIEIITDIKILENYKEELNVYFEREILPILTPISIAATHPFPNLITGALYLVVELEPEKEITDIIENVELSFIQIPSKIKGRFLNILDKNKFIPIENIIKLFLNKIYKGSKVISANVIKITRDADFFIDEDAAIDLLKEIETIIKRMHKRSIIKFEYEAGLPEHILKILTEKSNLKKDEIYQIKGILNLNELFELYKKIEQSDLKFPVREPIIKSDFKEKNIFDAISEKDYLLYHPYHSFDPIIDLLNKAAEDENVVAIKQLLYRTADDSQIIKALIKAAEKGKFVTVVFELKARFDEKRNIEWAKKLEDAGAHIIYGLAGYKIHSKALMIIRKEPSGTKKYIHLGTGNYNERTARLYTDLSYLTCDERLGEEVSELFNFLTGFSYPHTLTNIAIAPLNLRKKFLSLIERETENAKKGLKARIIAKMNSLCDKEIVQALYAAALAGVKIDLIVRGICVLRPNLIKISKNIKVRSIVGEFLEHSRIYYFYNAGSPEYYLSSADWMERNLDKRVEILFPIKHDKSKKFLNKILKIQLSKKIRHWELKNNGSYKLIKTNKSNFQSIYSFIIKEEKKQLKKKTINFRIIKKEEI